MKLFALYCKSYSSDLRRLVRLAQSVQQYNREELPFYVSVPEAELPLFQQYLTGLSVNLIADEDILKASPRINREQVQRMSGSMAQQVIKSELDRKSVV